jgi:hypothetical protein
MRVVWGILAAILCTSLTLAARLPMLEGYGASLRS